MMAAVAASIITPRFIGRRAEFERLVAAFEQATSGSAGVILLGGEAGIGKSRLVGEFATWAQARGARVVAGSCVEFGEDGMPFTPIMGVLRTVARALGPERFAELITGVEPEIARLVPDVRVPSQALAEAVGNERNRLFGALLIVLDRLCEDAPLLVVIEDAHWSDPSTRDMLAFLTRTAGTARVLFLVTYRTDELRRTHPLRPWLAELDRLSTADRMELSRFTVSEVADQLNSLRGEAPPSTVDSIYARSEGNPLFVEELVSSPDSTNLPASLRDLLLARVRRLPELSQSVLRTASAGGQQITHGLLSTITELDEIRLAEALRPAVAENVLLLDEDGYVFRHALLSEAIHDELLPGERVALHAKFAETLEADPSLTFNGQLVAATIAHHWYAAWNVRRAFIASLQAAREAGAAYAYAEQRRFLERVLALWSQVPDAMELADDDHAGILIQVAVATEYSADIEHALSYVDTALSELDYQRDAHRAAELLQRRGKMLNRLARPGAVESLHEALALLPSEPPSASRVEVLISLAGVLMLQPAPEEARAAAIMAKNGARALGDESLEVSATVVEATIDCIDGKEEAGVQSLAACQRAGVRLGLDHTVFRVATNLSSTLVNMSRYDEAIRVAEEGIANAKRLGVLRRSGALIYDNLIEAHIGLGNWDEADDLLERAIGLGPPGGHVVLLGAVRGLLHLQRGQIDAARVQLEAGRNEVSREFVSAQTTLPFSQLEAELARVDGDFARAAAVAEKELVPMPMGYLHRYLWPLATTGISAAADAKDAALALPLADWAANAPHQTLRAEAYAAVFTAERHRITDTDTPQMWRDAVRRCDLAGEPSLLGHAHIQLAAAALRDGDRDTASGALRAAEMLADRLKAPPLKERATDLARRSRLVVDAPSAAASLTTREREVLRLVATGASNGQIAEHLFISRKTASVHVSNILAKLGVASRGEAAAKAHRDGLL